MKQFFRRGLAALAAVVLVCMMALPGFAYDPNSSGTVTIPAGVTALSNGSIPKSARNIVNVRTVYVPSSVKTIGSGTFTGFINLRNVVIQNDRDAVQVSPGATSGSTRIIYSGAPAAHTTTRAVTHTTVPVTSEPAVRPRPGRTGTGSTRAAGRWAEELQQQATTQAQGQQNGGSTPQEPITVTNENGEVMMTIPGEADVPKSARDQGTPGMRALSWVLVGLAIVSAGVLVWMKVKKK